MTLRLAALTALLVAAPAAAQAPAPAFVHAHRGGPTLAGVHTFGEDTISSFRHAHLALGAVVELDAKLSADGVPVVIHDATLDRTTPCTGRVDAKTVAQLAGCPVDVLGSPGAELGGVQTGRTEPLATLAQALEVARDSGMVLNLEIKNIPTEPDFDPTSGFADTILDVVEQSRFPIDRLILQSFWPPNLDAAKARFPDVETSFLTLASLNDGAASFARGRGYDWVSPEWPVDSAWVGDAHAAGRKVVPFTLNTPGAIAAARAAGVDAVITDDPLMARRALGIPDPPSGDDEGPVVTLRVARLAWTSFRSPALRLRWRGTDPAGLAGYEAQVRRIGSRTWRTLILGNRISVRFRGSAGGSYVVRVRAQDNLGNLGRYASQSFVIPLDERDRRVRLAGGWVRVKRRAAWRGTVAQTSLPGSTVALSFRGRRLRVIGPRTRSGGRLAVTIGRRTRYVSTRGSGDRKILFDSGSLARGNHRATIRVVGGGPVAIDALAPS